MKIGLTIGRFQPVHKGHVRLINHMLMDCERILIGLGSSQESRTERNPFTAVERMEMLHRIFGKSTKIHIFPIEDINTKDKDLWTQHVFNTIKENALPIPTDYYGGCEADIAWYTSTTMNLRMIDRTCIIDTQSTNVRMDIAASGSMWRDLVPEVIVPMVEFYFPTELKNFKQLNIKIERKGS